MDIDIKDNSRKILDALNAQKYEALEAIGLAAEGFAKANLTNFPRVDTGRLRNSVSHARNEDVEYIGTNVEYAPYVELGTGIYAEDNDGNAGGGRTDVPWFYKDENGVGHLTKGMKPSHFLKKAVSDHKKELIQIAEENLKR